MFLGRALLRKGVSPVMIELREEAISSQLTHKSYSYASSIIMTNMVILLCSVFTAALYLLDKNEWVLGAIFLLMWVYAHFWLSMAIVRSCKELRGVIPNAAFLGRAELLEEAEHHLRKLAGHFARANAERAFDLSEMHARRVNEVYQTLRKFGLGMPGGYQNYLQIAEASHGAEPSHI